MPKKKNLNGLPYNVAQSFFSTLNYYKCAYMEDWLVNAALELKINEAVIDVMNASVEPASLNIYPITSTLKGTKYIIGKELLANNFPKDFVVELKFRLQFLNELVITNNKNMGSILHCYPWMKDIDGRLYEPRRLSIVSYISDFNPFDKDLLAPVR